MTKPLEEKEPISQIIQKFFNIRNLEVEKFYVLDFKGNEIPLTTLQGEVPFFTVHLVEKTPKEADPMDLIF